VLDDSKVIRDSYYGSHSIGITDNNVMLISFSPLNSFFLTEIDLALSFKKLILSESSETFSFELETFKIVMDYIYKCNNNSVYYKYIYQKYYRDNGHILNVIPDPLTERLK
jgi:hypothetical protein